MIINFNLLYTHLSLDRNSRSGNAHISSLSPRVAICNKLTWDTGASSLRCRLSTDILEYTLFITFQNKLRNNKNRD